jgi:hypothetical protein
LEDDVSTVTLSMNVDYGKDGLNAVNDGNAERDMRICMEFGPVDEFYTQDVNLGTGRPTRVQFGGNVGDLKFSRHRIQRFDRNNNELLNYKVWCSRPYTDYNWVRQPEKDAAG